jgi:beta-lactam-binding protein with PASTA domain
VSYEDHAVKELDDRFGWEIDIRMELLTPLFKYWQEHTYSVQDVVQLGIDICQALEVCQKYNIIHRDIKPENIFVSDIGKYKLGDFGIARQLEKTSSGLSKKGTYAYMAPEVYKGQPYNSNVDIYSLGIVLYRFLNNNRTPFLPPAPQEILYSDKENSNIKRMSGEKIEPPCNAKGRLVEIILKACSYDPKERYENAAEMKKALQTVLFDDEATCILPDEDFILNGSTLSSTDLKKTMKSSADSQDRVEIEDNSRDVMDEDDDKTMVLVIEEKSIKSEDEVKDIPEEKIAQEEADSDERHDIKPEGKKKIIAVAVIGCMIVAVCMGLFGYNMRQRTVPSVLNLSLDHADEILSDMGLRISVIAEEYSDSVEEGCIISQNLEEGEKVKENTTLEVVISKGSQLTETENIPVPMLTGLTKEEVQQLSLQYDLQFDCIEEYSDTVKVGYVISQEPQAETEVEVGSRVTIVISKGIEQVNVPSVVGKTIAGAKEALEEEFLVCEVKETYSNSVKQGYVISQNIEAGENVTKNTTVIITVSKGSEPNRSQSSHSSSSNSKNRSSSSNSTSNNTTNNSRTNSTSNTTNNGSNNSTSNTTNSGSSNDTNNTDNNSAGNTTGSSENNTDGSSENSGNDNNAANIDDNSTNSSDTTNGDSDGTNSSSPAVEDMSTP